MFQSKLMTQLLLDRVEFYLMLELMIESKVFDSPGLAQQKVKCSCENESSLSYRQYVLVVNPFARTRPIHILDGFIYRKKEHGVESMNPQLVRSLHIGVCTYIYMGEGQRVSKYMNPLTV